MSIPHDFSNRVQGARPQQDAHGVDHARHDHRRRRRHHDGGARHRRAELDRRADSVGRHQHDHRDRRQLHAGRRAPGPGQRQHARPRRRGGDRAGSRACSTSPPASNTRGQIVAGNQNWNTQVQGTDVDFPLIRAWPTTEGAFFTPQDVTTAAKVAVLGSVVRDQLFGPDVEPGRPGHPHFKEPALHRRRRDGASRASRASARIRTTSSSCRTRRS